MLAPLRQRRPAVHRALGKVYLGAVTISVPVAVFIGTTSLEPLTIRFEQYFQGGLWLLSSWIASACIRSGQMALHKAWVMRSYGFTLVFIFSRVPDAFITG